MNETNRKSLHPRVLVVQKATAAIGLSVIEHVETYELTMAETIEALNTCIAMQAKYLILEERASK